jgi:carboxypeptidase C (cathepsin A)
MAFILPNSKWNLIKQKEKKLTMDYAQLTKKMIDCQKTSFSNFYDTVGGFQDQAASELKRALQENAWFWPEEGRKAVQGWMDAFLQGRGHLRVYVDEGFANLEKYVSEGQKTAPNSGKGQASQGIKATRNGGDKQALTGNKSAQGSVGKQTAAPDK